MNVLTVFDFKNVNSNQPEDTIIGDFEIIYYGKAVGYLNIAESFDTRYVSVEIPDVNFELNDWISFLQTIKGRFRICDTQRIMMNKYPNSIELYA